ncbi:MAG: hypothetical protein WEA61_10130 [Anaerolineales bacterium]
MSGTGGAGGSYLASCRPAGRLVKMILFLGEFIALATGLPGTETFTGTVAIGASVLIEGTYSYGDDPGVTCEGQWPITAEFLLD